MLYNEIQCILESDFVLSLEVWVIVSRMSTGHEFGSHTGYEGRMGILGSKKGPLEELLIPSLFTIIRRYIFSL